MTKITGPLSGAFSYTLPLTDPGTCCAFVRDFVVVGALDSDPYAIRWSAIGDATDFPVPATDDARTKQAGQQVFPVRHGIVTGISGNDFFMYIFQERAISKGVYQGGDTVWSFDTFEEDRGCQRGGSMVQVDDKVFFQSDRGYHVLEGDQITDIGYGIVDGSY